MKPSKRSFLFPHISSRKCFYSNNFNLLLNVLLMVQVSSVAFMVLFYICRGQCGNVLQRGSGSLVYFYIFFCRPKLHLFFFFINVISSLQQFKVDHICCKGYTSSVVVLQGGIYVLQWFYRGSRGNIFVAMGFLLVLKSDDSVGACYMLSMYLQSLVQLRLRLLHSMFYPVIGGISYSAVKLLHCANSIFAVALVENTPRYIFLESHIR